MERALSITGCPMRTMLKILILLGGGYHDFKEGGRIIEELLRKRGIEFDTVWDKSVLKDLPRSEYKAVLLYTQGGKLTGEEERGLLEFIRSGGGYAGIHSASDSFKENTEYIKLVGAYFVRHPPVQQLNIKVVDRTHPITRGLSDFTTVDELYIQEHVSDKHVLLEAHLEDIVEPVCWVRNYGEGRVFYISLGHDPNAISNENFQEVLVRGIKWAAGVL